jgi:hypothetical protein
MRRTRYSANLRTAGEMLLGASELVSWVGMHSPVLSIRLYARSRFLTATALVRDHRHCANEEGRKRVRRGVRRPLAEWDVLLKDQHEGYISWAEFERNQLVIANNATGKGSAVARGAARHGELLLAGLLRCGHCGRKMYVAYGGKAGRYHGEGALVNHGTERCISFGGLRADDAVGTEVLRVLKPLGIMAR